jgi:hypothetical protein
MATKCTNADQKGRLHKARQFLEAADIIDALADEDDLIDAYITLCVHAGIAAADVISCARLGVHSQGQSHAEAITLLARADGKLSKDLAQLLGMKTRAGYGPTSSAKPTRKTAGRCATRLVEAAVAI